MQRFCFLLVPFCLLLPGCLPFGHWIEGKWQFDAEQTRAANEQIQAGDSGPIIAKIKQLAGSAVEGYFSAGLEGATLEFTRSEVRILQGDSGKSAKYEIIEKPDANTVIISREGGKIETYHREGNRLWFKPSDSVSLKIYLKPAP